MKYPIVSHPTFYNGVWFRSRLVAQWACFFDLAGWTWEYEPIDLDGWTPDFRVKFSCGHSECSGSYTLVAAFQSLFTSAEIRCLTKSNHSRLLMSHQSPTQVDAHVSGCRNRCIAFVWKPHSQQDATVRKRWPHVAYAKVALASSGATTCMGPPGD